MPPNTEDNTLLNIPIRANISAPMYNNIQALIKRFGGVLSEADILRIALNYFFEYCYNDTEDVYLLFNINKKTNGKSVISKENPL